MTIHQRALPRAIAGVRADVSDPAKLFAELNKAFAEFKASNDERIKALEKGREDVVTNEKVDRINAAITAIETAQDDLAKKVAAASLAGAGKKHATPEIAAYAKAFETYFRTGEGEGGLKALAVQAALQRQSDPDGGYVVVPELDLNISRVLSTVSAMRQVAQVQTISTNALSKLVSQGGATSGWVGETESRSTTSTPTLAKLDFPAMEIYANPGATQSLLDDAAVDIEAWLASEVAVEFAEEEGAAFVTGSGVNRPRGLMSYTFVANASYAWGSVGYIAGGAASTLTDPDKLVELEAALRPGYKMNASFMMNRSTAASIRKLADGIGQYIWQPGLQAGQPATLLGKPVVLDDNFADIGANTYPIAFGDFSRAYLIVDRMGTRVLRDPYTNKPYVQFYTTKRVGGGVQNFEAFKALKIATS